MGKLSTQWPRSPKRVSHFSSSARQESRCSISLKNLCRRARFLVKSTWPTQPFPVKPPPFIRQSFKAGRTHGCDTGIQSLLQQAHRRSSLRNALYADRVEADCAFPRYQRRGELGRSILRSRDQYLICKLDGRRYAAEVGESAGDIKTSFSNPRQRITFFTVSGI